MLYVAHLRNHDATENQAPNRGHLKYLTDIPLSDTTDLVLRFMSWT